MVFHSSAMLSAVVGSIVLMTSAAQANERRYPEPIARSLLQACFKSEGILIPFKSNQPVTKPEKTLSMLISEDQFMMNSFITQRQQKNSNRQEQDIDTAIQKRLVELRKQVENKEQLKKELQLVRTLLSTGMSNGEKISPEELARLRKSEQELSKLQKDPSYVEVMAKAAREEELKKARDYDQVVITKAKLSLSRMTECGCALEKVQTRYSLDELADRIKLEITNNNGISQDIQSSMEQCKLPKK